MKRILFPTDFSDAANNAFKVAMDIAISSGAELFLLHSLNSAQQYVDISLTSAGDITMPGMQPEIVMAAIEEEKKRVTKKMEEACVQVTAASISVYSELIHQPLDVEINDFVTKHEIDFIVMGTHGASGLKEAFIGSTAQKIVRIAKVPVLTVNDAYENFRINRIVCCSDFLEEEINNELPRVKRFADMFDAKLDLLYVNTPTYFEETGVVEGRMNEICEAKNLTDVGKYIYNAYDIDEGATSFADSHGANVIAMITHGFRGVKKLFSDNVTESVVNHSKLPVLTLHIQK